MEMSLKDNHKVENLGALQEKAVHSSSFKSFAQIFVLRENPKRKFVPSIHPKYSVCVRKHHLICV